MRLYETYAIDTMPAAMRSRASPMRRLLPLESMPLCVSDDGHTCDGAPSMMRRMRAPNGFSPPRRRC